VISRNRIDFIPRPEDPYVEKPGSVRCKKMQFSDAGTNERPAPNAQHFRHFLRILA